MTIPVANEPALIPLGLHRTRAKDCIHLALAAGDFLVFFLTQMIGFWIRFYSGWIESLPVPFLDDLVTRKTNIEAYDSHFGVGSVLFVLIAIYFRLSRLDSVLRPQFSVREIARVIGAWAVTYLLLALVFSVDPPISRIFVFVTAILAVATLLVWRILFLKALVMLGAVECLQKRILVVGWTRETQRMWLRMGYEQVSPIRFVGVVHSLEKTFKEPPPKLLDIVGEFADIEHLITKLTPDAVMLADLNPSVRETTDLVNLCHKELVSFIAIPSFFEVLASGVRQESILGVPTITIGKLPLDHLLNRLIKRFIDIAGGFFGLILFSPVMVFFFIIVWLESRGPVIYTQTRSGRIGRPFKIYKIRSMKLNAESGTGAVWAQPDDDRRLRVGAFMRAWNVDELPQFWNVLKGDMSLVGPRPERPELIEEFKKDILHYTIRLTVKPGITGWAAVNGLRGDTDLNERIRFDIDYIERWSLPFDFYVMLLTFLRNKNAY